MQRRIIWLAAALVTLAALVFSESLGQPPTAYAAPPPPCPSALIPPSGVTYHVFATLPVGVPAASAVCIQIPGFPVLNSGLVTQAPAGCPAIVPPSVDAGGSGVAGWVWADWGAACVPAGQTVVLQFQGPPGLVLGRVTNAAFWSNGVTTDATVWPAECPTSPPGVGGVPLIAKAVAPVGGPYDGVCMTFVAPIPGVHTPVVLLNPPLCPTTNTVLGAAVLQVWDDFTTKCANAGDTLIVHFFGPPGLIGPCPGCATWLDGAVTGDVTITAASSSVGGIAEAPDASAPRAVATSGAAAARTGWIAGISGGMLLLAVGGWYTRRRRIARD